MKKFLLFVLVVGAAGWIAQRNDMLPFQDSAPYAAFQEFATAMVRADVDTVGKFANEESVKKQASNTYLMMRRVIRDIHQVDYRLEAEDPSADGKQVLLSVSHGLTIDPVGSFSAFGIMACEGKYAVRMTETATGWKVASFHVESSTSRPERPLMVVPHRDSTAEWPCAEGQWMAFGNP